MAVASHLTAIHRNRPSIPLRNALEYKLLTKRKRILDFGCGRGGDTAWLKQHGYRAHGYDPFYQPKMPRGKFDFVLCSYVLNVIAQQERRDVLWTLTNICRGYCMITVRSRGEVDKVAAKGCWKMYQDGFLTPKNTFQHGFISDELDQLLVQSGFTISFAVPTGRNSVCVVATSAN